MPPNSRLCKSPSAAKRIINQINKMAEQDQKMRLTHQKHVAKWDRSVDKMNTMAMKKIIKSIGWPSISKVGKKTSINAWLLVQHADHDPKFQRKCLTLMQALPKGQVSSHNLAYLEDRVLLNEGKKQIYGTQFTYSKKGNVKPRPLKDKKNLAKLRKNMGLGSFEKKLAKMQKTVDEYLKTKSPLE